MDFSIAIFLLSIAIYMLYLTMKSATLECKKQIEYRYVPRTFKEEQAEPIKVSSLFSDMFENAPVR